MNPHPPRPQPADWRGRSPEPPPRRPHRTVPVIGITADIIEPRPGRPRAVCAITYPTAIAAAGAIPLILPPITPLIHEQLRLVDGVVLTGGDDPRTEPFGQPTHPKATPMHPDRQEYETALLRALQKTPAVPVLGICLGMQLMALAAGGRLDQHLPESLATHLDHYDDRTHPVLRTTDSPLGTAQTASSQAPAGSVSSHHRQAVADAGRLRVIATAPDGVIEAIDDPARLFYLGVQWHPERTADPDLGARIFALLVDAARRSAAPQQP